MLFMVLLAFLQQYPRSQGLLIVMSALQEWEILDNRLLMDGMFSDLCPECLSATPLVVPPVSFILAHIKTM